jgi:hypothetical protein
MRGLSLPQLVRPWAALATPPTDDTAPAAPRRAAPRTSVRSALDPNAAPCGVPTTFELSPDPAY